MTHTKPCANIHAANFAHGWSENDFQSFLNDKSCLFLVAETTKGDVCTGFIVIKQALDEAEILTIAVDKKFQNQKLGSRLLENALPLLKQRGVKSFFLEVAQDNKSALALYNKFRFQEVGKRKGYYPKKGAISNDALILKRVIA